MRAEMRKETFWNRERVAKNIAYKDLCDLFGGVVSKWGSYFSGQIMPDPLTIKHLCELFDVDITKGTEEFKKAHALWKSEHHKSKVICTTGKSERSILTNGVTVQDTAPQFEESVVTESAIDVAGIIQFVYGKLPYETFMTFRSMIKNCTGDPIEFVYGKVSYKEFRQIQEALKDE